MHIGVSIHIIGVLLMLFSCAMLPSLGLGLVAKDGSASAFSLSFALIAFAGLCLWLPTRHCKNPLQIRDGFLVTALFWTVLGVFGSLPFLLSASLNMSVGDSIFESVSGLTTTGGTVIVGLDDLPRSVLFYRQLLQWLGGVGIIVLAVAILPMLGIGGMQLYRAESTGPSKGSKLTPRITDTAKALFGVYLGLTAACGICYWLAGMSVFDAICHAFSTVSTGGLSTHDASMGYFDSDIILFICTIFMTLGAVSFGLMFLAFQRRDLAMLRNDSETTFFSWILLLAAGVTSLTLVITNTLPFDEAIVNGIFHTVSIATTSGFSTQDFTMWPVFLPFLLLMLSFMGGCVGSTGGGMKAMRVLLIFRQGMRELKQLLHPNAVIPLKLDSRRVQPAVVSAVWSFFAVYMVSFVAFNFVMLTTGVDFETAFSSVVATMNNLGPGLGAVSTNYASISEVGKITLSLAMLVGRLEVFTVLVLLTPTFWRP